MNSLQIHLPAQSARTSAATTWPNQDEPPLHFAVLGTFLHGGAVGTLIGLGAALIYRFLA